MLLQSLIRSKLPSKIIDDALADPRAVGLVNKAALDQSDSTFDILVFPSLSISFEMLRRPIEFTQYTCEAYVDYLEKNNFQISMSRVATPEDNAFIESFFKTLKREEIYARNYETMADVLNHLPKFIDEIYNEKRLHSSLGYRPPTEFEAEILKLKPADRPIQKICLPMRNPLIASIIATAIPWSFLNR